jgi:lipid II:glycine glycyltransferase (peptidoglycan interpeptide bridge formation enzyme)
LVWLALEFGCDRGFHTFDFGGGGKPDEEYGVRDFKAKFGGDLVNYGRNVLVHSPIQLQASELGYQLLRRFL